MVKEGLLKSDTRRGTWETRAAGRRVLANLIPRRNLEQMRLFDFAWPIAQTVSAQSESDGTLLQNASVRPRLHAVAGVGSAGLSKRIVRTPSAQSMPIVPRFPLSWSHYVKLLSVQKPEARAFYETEACLASFAAKDVLPYRGLGTGIRRVLADWPSVDLIR